MDALFQLAVSNLCVSSALALLAYGVHRRRRHPLLAHLLWLLVLVKLVTPPVFTVPVIPVASAEPHAEVVDEPRVVSDSAPFGPIVEPLPAAPVAPMTGRALGRPALLLVWVLGSLFTCAWSLVRVLRFQRQLSRASRPAPAEVRRLAHVVARRLGLRSVPAIVTTTARISPFVWWIGGRTRVVLSESVIAELGEDELRLVLGHELAHVRRRDHWVRWIEWLACIGFWWNPIAWLARRNLRINEEIGCDALVLESLRPDRRTYASSLLTVAEFLSTGALRPPAVASAMNSGGHLERRLTMIVARNPMKTPRWLQVTVLSLAACVLPMSLAYGQDYKAVERRLGEAVAAGELSLEQAQIMLDALRRASRDDPARASDGRRAEYDRVEAKVRAAVEAGKLSREDAEKKLSEVRERIFAGPERPLAEHIERHAAELEAAVKAGKVSREDANRRLEEMRRAYAESTREADVAERMQRAAEEIEAALKSGKLTREEAREKHEALRRRYTERMRAGEREKPADSDARTREERMKRMAAELEAAVQAGKVSREDANRRLEEMRRAYAESTREADVVERMQRAAEEIEAALKAGKLTREEAREKHEALRRRYAERMRAGEREKPAEHVDTALETRRKRYAEIEREVRAAVEQGKLSREDAEKKLIAARKKIFEK